MAKISINLLPPEILAEQIKGSKFYKIQLIGIAVILLLIFLSSLTVALRILQSHNISEVQAKVDAAQQQISGLRSTEASLLLLKNRLAIIDQYLGVPSKQSSIYTLLDKLISSSVAINSMTIDKTGDAVLLVSAPNSDNLESLVESLTIKESNEDKISQVSIDSLNRGRDGLYRVSLKIKAK